MASSPAPEFVSINRWDQVYDALSHVVRRRLLISLHEAGEQTPVVLPNAAGPDSGEPPVHDLEIKLKHHHLPKLADYEYVEWDTSPFQASRGRRFGEIDSVLEPLLAQAGNYPPSLVIGCDALESRM